MKYRSTVKWLCAALCGLLAACAIITVNVYFPEKDVKQAYKSLDEMLLKESGGSSPVREKPELDNKNVTKPQSLLQGGKIRFSLVGSAWADEPVADQLAVELASMPEVLNAYEEMKQRLPQLDLLRNNGVVGENKQGLISVRDKARLGGSRSLVDDENRNRKTVITAMAKAILKINNQPVTDANVDKLLGKAAATYAANRQEQARPGWWIELQNGRWVQK